MIDRVSAPSDNLFAFFSFILLQFKAPVCHHMEGHMQQNNYSVSSACLIFIPLGPSNSWGLVIQSLRIKYNRRLMEVNT
jgi:hypothetical protein